MNLEAIAKLAGVSRSTVSRVINDDPRVSQKTREKVQAIIEEEGYQPNLAARSLVTRRTQTIGVVVPKDLDMLFDNSFYFPTLLRGISRAATQRDYAMLLMIGQHEGDDTRFMRRFIRRGMVDGVIVISPPVNHPVIDELTENNILFVSADRIPARRRFTS